jgi:hypothetical protein
MIAGKTHSEIISMEKNKRYRWYETIPKEERKKAMKIMEKIRRSKLRESQTGKTHSEETKIKISASLIGITRSEETKIKMSISKRGEKNHQYGKPLSEEHKGKISEALSGERNYFFDKTHSEETKIKLSISKRGEKNPSWKGGVTFEPYCPAFNDRLKEYIRNLCNRTCTICGKSALQSIDKNGVWLGRLDIDHLDENKLQGCGDWEWRLTALCPPCHGKMQNQESHLLLQLLLLKNKKHQTNLLFGDE